MIPIEYVGYASAHAGRKVLSGPSQDDSAASRHILETMVAAALSHRDCAGISDTEAFAGHAAYICLAGCCPVEGYVADDDIILRLEYGILRRI